MSDYRKMWKGLGLDLEAHDALLNVLGQAYADTFLTQQNRPQGMKYFDFVMSEVHGLRIKELMEAKAAGRKVVGSFCVFVPEEIVLAVDGVHVGLCAGAEFGYEKAEQIIPRNTCPLIKSFFGFKLMKVCPYLEASDLIVGENTCDGKKKAYEIFGEMVKRFYLIDLPQVKSDAGRALLKDEFAKFAKEIEDLSGKKITADSLKKGIRTANAKREVLGRLSALRHADPAPISGLDALLVNQVSFYDDPLRFTDSVNKLCDELEQRVKEGKGVFPRGTPRIVFSGCPMAVPNWKMAAIVESSAAVVVGEESCVGERSRRWLTEVKGSTVAELIERITDRCFKIDCAVLTPNPARREHTRDMVKNYHARGVIHYALQFCTPYQMESGPEEVFLKESGIPVLKIETDYSPADAGQLKNRVEAFIEMIK